jgi:MFS family permease
MSIFPYVYFMIDSFHITSDTNRIALFAGLVTSVFAAAECLGGGFWGNLSDRIGRKPVLLTGLAGTGISMIIFGFSPNLAVALFARALGGALNGNIGVLQTTVNEVVKVKAHQARAFAVMPTVWCLGAFIGSGLGGALADPVRNYPSTFRQGTIFEKFPYLLTNLVCTSVVIFCLIVGFLFMEETHEEKKNRRDIGLELGDRIIRCFYKDYRRHQLLDEKDESMQSTSSARGSIALTDDELPDYTSNAASPALPAYRSLEATPRPSLMLLEAKNGKVDVEEALSRAGQYAKAKGGFSKAFTKQVILNIFGFGILAL